MIRFGIVGAGQISHACCNQVKGAKDIELTAIAEPHEGRREDMVKAFGFKTSYANGEELFADPNIDAVYIAVPNKFHAPLAEAALKAGKHVILDKPFALSSEEAERVAAAAKASGKIFMLGMNRRFTGPSQTMRSIVKEGRLGEIYHAKAYWFRRTGIPKMGTWFGNKDLAGGGCMLDIGVHLLDLALYVTDNFEPMSVTGTTYTKFGHRGLGEGGWGMSEKSDIQFNVDDFAAAFIKFKNGMSINLSVSWACHQEQANNTDIELFGTEGGALVEKGQIFEFGENPGEYKVTQNPKPKAEVEYKSDRFRNFFDAIEGKQGPCVTLEQALTVQKILDGIYKSCATGREVLL